MSQRNIKLITCFNVIYRAQSIRNSLQRERIYYCHPSGRVGGVATLSIQIFSPTFTKSYFRAHSDVPNYRSLQFFPLAKCLFTLLTHILVFETSTNFLSFTLPSRLQASFQLLKKTKNLGICSSG